MDQRVVLDFVFITGYFIDNILSVVCFLQLMLDSWNQSIFSNIKDRLQGSAMKLVHAERNGEAFDSQLVIGVRESYGEFVVLYLATVCTVSLT